MSSDDNHWRAHMTRTARNIWTCAVYATSSFNFGLPAYFVSHYCCSRALYAVFYRKVCLKKIIAELLTVMSKVTHLLVCLDITEHISNLKEHNQSKRTIHYRSTQTSLGNLLSLITMFFSSKWVYFNASTILLSARNMFRFKLTLSPYKRRTGIRKKNNNRAKKKGETIG